MLASKETIAQLVSQRTAKEELIKRLQVDCTELDEKIEVEAEQQPCYLLDLPCELRLKILQGCVAPGKVFVGPSSPRDRRFDDRGEYYEPCMAAFKICRQMRREAAELFFAENMFVMSVEMRSRSFPTFQQIISAHSLVLPTTELTDMDKLAYTHMRSASVAFDVRNSSFDALEFATTIRKTLGDVDKLSQARRGRLGHAAMRPRAHRNWLMGVLHATGSGTRFLQLDVSHCYCPMGCCRLSSRAGAVPQLLDDSLSIECVEILGTKMALERDGILRGWVRYLRMPGSRSARWKSAKDHSLILRFKAFVPGELDLRMLPGSNDGSVVEKRDLEEGLVTVEINLWDYVGSFGGKTSKAKCPTS